MKEFPGKFEKKTPKSEKEALKEENEILKTENFLRSFIAQGHSIDSLTELKRREILESELTQSLKIIRGEVDERRTNAESLKEVSLIFMDIDNFKNINDTYGHSAGDEVLRKIAKLLTSSVRGSDMVARWGGEEFTVLLRGASISIAESEAENLRAKIEQLTFTTYPDLHVTASLGVVSSEKSHDAKELYELADEALYKAKESGRNRVVIAEKE
jgi:diguanylate cyclase (GGDEF)-like protein